MVRMLRSYRAFIYVAIIFSICLAPLAATATLIEEVSLEYIFDDTETALLEVCVYSEGDNLFTYEYDLTNTGSKLILDFMSVGYGLSSSSEEYVILDHYSVQGSHLVQHNEALYYPEWNWFRDGSLNINFDPLLGPEQSIAFSITYKGFVFEQDIGVAGNLGAGDPKTIYYEKPEPSPAPVPEPATLFILGSGIISLGLLSRRRRTK